MPSLPMLSIYIAAGILAVLVILFFINKPVLVIYFQILYCFVVFYMVSMGIPQFAKYLTDMLTFLLLLQIFFQRGKSVNANVRAPLFCVILFAAVCLVGFIGNWFGNGASLVFFLWGLRVYFRCYIFLWACIVFLKTEDIVNLLRIFIALLPVNAALCSFQKFYLGYGLDYIGGLFGTTRGCDSMMNLYLLIVCTVLVVWYMDGRTGIAPCAAGVGLTLYIAAIAELKFLFFEVMFILLAAAVLYFPKRQTIILPVVGAAVILATIALYGILYPQGSGFFNTESIGYYTAGTGYSGEGSLNRLTAGSYILENIFETIPAKLFGVGLGNADRFLDFTSNFYMEYAYLRYIWFMYAFLIVEAGLLGLAAYSLFFVAVLYDSWRISLKAGKELKSFLMISLLMCPMSFALMVYNSSMHSEAAYFLFLVMAFPYIIEKEANLRPVKYHTGINIPQT